MPKKPTGQISVNQLAIIGRDAYSRPHGLIQQMCLDIIHRRSSRGTTTIERVEEIAKEWIANNPDSTSSISIFLSQAQNIAGK